MSAELTVWPLFISKPAPAVSEARGTLLMLRMNPGFLGAYGRDLHAPWRPYHEAGYILDAPETMPAGGCQQEIADGVDGEPDVYLAFQQTTERES